MKITFDVAAFAEAAKAIRDIPGSSRDIDILSHARIAVDGTRLALTMSDLDIEGRAIIDCEADADLLAAIPAAVLDFFVSRAGVKDASDRGTLEFDGDLRTVVARQGKARMTIQILRGDHFPVFSSAAPTWSFSIRAHELCHLFTVCRKAISDEPARPQLTGLFLHEAKAGVATIAIDGNRLHLAESDVTVDGAMPVRSDGAMAGVLLTDRTVDRIAKIFGGDESEIAVSGTASTVAVESGQLRIVAKLIDETFPVYPKLIQQLGSFRITLQATALDQALARLTLIPKSDGKGKAMKVRIVEIEPDDGEIRLSAAGDLGDAEDRVEATIEGDPVAFKVNIRLLREAIEAAGGGEIVVVPPAEKGKGLVRILGRDEARTIGVMEYR